MSAGEGVPMMSLDRAAWPAPATAERELRPLPAAPLKTESSFYAGYAWCLDVFPTVRDVSRRLRDELLRPEEAIEDWQRQEVALNAFMLSCAMVDAVDDYTAGESYDFSAAAVLPGMGVVTGALEPFPPDKMERLYGSDDGFRKQFAARVDELVGERWLLPDDGEVMGDMLDALVRWIDGVVV